MLRKLYDGVFDLARGRHATPALAVVAFAESSFFPIPPDVMLAPMILARPEKAYFYAGVCTLASVLGGILGYAIGYFLTDLGLAILRVLGHSDGLDHFRQWFAQWGPVGHTDQGVHPHSLQAGDNRLGPGGLQLPDLHGGVGRDPGRPVLPRGLDSEALGGGHACPGRETPGAVVRDRPGAVDRPDRDVEASVSRRRRLGGKGSGGAGIGGRLAEARTGPPYAGVAAFRSGAVCR